MNFAQNLYKSMKLDIFMMTFKKTIMIFLHTSNLIWDYLCKYNFKGICHVFASLMYHWKKQNKFF
jgi:hypothetical protein